MKRFAFLLWLFGLCAMPTTDCPAQPVSDANTFPAVFWLKYAKAETVATALANTLRQMHGDNQAGAVIVPDSRLNAVYVQAAPSLVKEIEEFVKQLDTSLTGASAPLLEQPQDSREDPGTFAEANDDVSQLPGDVAGARLARETSATQADLRKRYDLAERKSLDLAARLRQLQSSRPKDTQRLDELKTELREIVAESFGIRRELQREELARFQQRLVKAQVIIELRHRIQDQIIDRRVEDLINPALKWEVISDAGPQPPSGAAAPQDELGPTVPTNALDGQSGQEPTAREPLARTSDVAVLTQLVELAERERDRVRAMVQGGVISTFELLTAEKDLAERRMHLAESTGNWMEVERHAEESVRFSQQAVDHARTSHEKGIEQGGELYRMQASLLEAQAKLRTLRLEMRGSAVAPNDPSLRRPVSEANESDQRKAAQLGDFSNKSPSEYAQAVRGIRDQIAEMEAEIKRYGLDHPRAQQPSRQVTAARQQLEILTLEFRTQVQLAELHLRAMEGELDRTKRELEHAVPLRQQRIMSSTAFQSLESRADQSRHLVDRARAVWQLYKDTEQTLFRDPSTLIPPPKSDATDTNDDSSAKILWDELGVKLEAVPLDSPNSTSLRGGLRIVELRPGSPAELEGMRVHDVLVGLHRWETLTLQNAVYALRHTPPSTPAIAANVTRRIKFHILREGQLLFGSVRLALTAPAVP